MLKFDARGFKNPWFYGTGATFVGLGLMLWFGSGFQSDITAHKQDTVPVAALAPVHPGQAGPSTAPSVSDGNDPNASPAPGNPNAAAHEPAANADPHAPTNTDNVPAPADPHAATPKLDANGNPIPPDLNRPGATPPPPGNFSQKLEIPTLQGIPSGDDVPEPVRQITKSKNPLNSSRYGVELSDSVVETAYSSLVKTPDFDVAGEGAKTDVKVEQVPYALVAFHNFSGVEYGTGPIPAISHVLPPHEGMQRTNPLYLPALPVGTLLEGTASWYGAEEHGTTTACMVTYDMFKPTLATREIPCGTRVMIINEAGQHVEAITTDWGPAEWTTRRFDLSPVVFEKLANLSSGVIPVRVITLSGPSKLK